MAVVVVISSSSYNSTDKVSADNGFMYIFQYCPIKKKPSISL